MQDVTPQQQYLSNWHDNFVKYVQLLWTYMDTFENHLLATDMDKRGLDAIKVVLSGNDVLKIEKKLVRRKYHWSFEERYVRKDRKV